MSFFRFLLGDAILSSLPQGEGSSTSSSSSAPLAKPPIDELELLKRKTSELFQKTHTQSRTELMSSYEELRQDYQLFKLSLRQNLTEAESSASPKKVKELTKKLQETQELLSSLKKIAKRALDHYQPTSLQHELVSIESSSTPKQKPTKTTARDLVFLYHLFKREKSLLNEGRSSKRLLREIKNQFDSKCLQLENKFSGQQTHEIPTAFQPSIFRKYQQQMELELSDESSPHPTLSTSSSSQVDTPDQMPFSPPPHTLPKLSLQRLVEAFEAFNLDFSLSLGNRIINSGDLILLMNEIEKCSDPPLRTEHFDKHMENIVLQLATHILHSPNIAENVEALFGLKGLSSFLTSETYTKFALALMRNDCYHAATNAAMKVSKFSNTEAVWSQLVEIAIEKKDLELAGWISQMYEKLPFSNNQLLFSLNAKIALAFLEIANDFPQAKAHLIKVNDDLVDKERYLAMLDLFKQLASKQGYAAAVNEALEFTLLRTETFWSSDAPPDHAVQFASEALKIIAHECIKNGHVTEAIEIFSTISEHLLTTITTPLGAKNQHLKDEIMILFSLELMRLKDIEGAKKAIKKVTKDSTRNALLKDLQRLSEKIANGPSLILYSPASSFVSSSTDSLTSDPSFTASGVTIADFISQYKMHFHLTAGLEEEILTNNDFETLLQEVERSIAEASPELRTSEEIKVILSTLAQCIESSPFLGELSILFLNSPIFSPLAKDETYCHLATALFNSGNYRLSIDAIQRIQNFSTIDSMWNTILDRAVEMKDPRLAVLIATAYEQIPSSNEILSITLLKKAALCLIENTHNYKQAFSLLMRTKEDLLNLQRANSLLDLVKLLSKRQGIEAALAITNQLTKPTYKELASNPNLGFLTDNFRASVWLEMALQAARNEVIPDTFRLFNRIPQSLEIPIATNNGAKLQSVKDEVFILFAKELLRLNNLNAAKKMIGQIFSPPEVQTQLLRDVDRLSQSKQRPDFWSI